MHADERRGMKKPVLRQLKDELVEVLGRHAKCIHQGCLDGAGYLGNPGLVVAAFDNVDFCEWHNRSPLCCRKGACWIEILVNADFIRQASLWTPRRPKGRRWQARHEEIRRA